MRLSRRFGWFLAAGLLGLAVDVAALYLLAPFWNWYAARLASFLLAATATWQVNRRFAFADGAAGQGGLLREYLRYLFAMMGGAVVNYAAYVVVLRSLEGFWVPAFGVACGSVAGLFVNFAAARWLVFARQPRI